MLGDEQWEAWDEKNEMRGREKWGVEPRKEEEGGLGKAPPVRIANCEISYITE